MSDEIIQLAKKEINEELDAIDAILNHCNSDGDISKNAENIHKHTHKIKGLTELAKKNDLAEINSLLDSLMQEIKNKEKLNGLYPLISSIVKEMKKSMTLSNYDLTKPTSALRNFSNNY